MSQGAAQLPRIDEHSAAIGANPEATWNALLRVLDGSFSSGPTPRVSRVLGCADTEATGPRPLVAGSTFPGFHVESAEEGRELALAGNHRFSDYALIFRLDDLGEDGTLLRAETRAEFPGLRGEAYKTMVIRTGGHVLVTRRLLEATRRRAERAGA